MQVIMLVLDHNVPYPTTAAINMAMVLRRLQVSREMNPLNDLATC